MIFVDRRMVFITVLAILLTSFFEIAPSSAAVVTFPGARPFKLFVPTSYDPANPAPLILALHGYSSSGNEFEKYLKLTAVAQARGILYVHPDGTADKAGNRFWNATPECCDFQTPKVNDDAYLMSIIDQVSQKYAVDPQRIYIIGHSNGGFMTNHMACEHADQIAAVVNMAGGSYVPPSVCNPAVPISVLQIWGTADETYKGNHILGKAIPGAVKTIAAWGALDKCSKKMVSLPAKLDLEEKPEGSVTKVNEFQNCASNVAVDSWTIVGGDHVLDISKTFTADVVDFLLAHPKVIKQSTRTWLYN